jgi:hypothetical protein
MQLRARQQYAASKCVQDHELLDYHLPSKISKAAAAKANKAAAAARALLLAQAQAQAQSQQVNSEEEEEKGPMPVDPLTLTPPLPPLPPSRKRKARTAATKPKRNTEEDVNITKTQEEKETGEEKEKEKTEKEEDEAPLAKRVRAKPRVSTAATPIKTIAPAVIPEVQKPEPQEDDDTNARPEAIVTKDASKRTRKVKKTTDTPVSPVLEGGGGSGVFDFVCTPSSSIQVVHGTLATLAMPRAFGVQVKLPTLFDDETVATHACAHMSAMMQHNLYKRPWTDAPLDLPRAFQPKRR